MEFNQINNNEGDVNNTRAWMGPEPLQMEELRQACLIALRWIMWVRGSGESTAKGHQPPPEHGGDQVVRILKKALRKEGK